MPATHSVVFNPSGIRAVVPDGATVLDAARAGGVDLDSVCGGRGLCGRCQVSPVTTASLSPPGPTELNYRGRRPLADRCRLGCGAVLIADAVIDVPEQSQIHRPVVRKSIDLTGVTVDPVVTLHYVELPKPSLGSEATEVDMLAEALAADWQLTDVQFPPQVLARLSEATAGSSRDMTAVVHDRRTVLDVRPGYSDGAWGVAVDVGSTTVAGYLLDLATGELAAAAGRMNPQIRFGEDLMSRVSYVMMNPGGTAELTAAVRGALDDLISELCENADVDPDTVHDLVIVGNPIMHHLVLGLDPTALGAAPFTLTTADAVRAHTRDLGLALRRAALYTGPCIAGHVGADAAAAALAEGPHRSREPMLVVDVGTNAEIILGDGKQVLAASSPTGPAFEGAQISAGQRATPGAIERVRIDAATWEPRFKVIGCDLWSDDTQFESALQQAGLQVSGLCGSGIIEVVAEMFLAGILDRHGAITSDTSRSPRIVADGRTFSYVLADEPILVSLTQNDVRAVQLAKAALRAGIDLLREHADVDEVADVRLAGAFGTHIDPVRAMVLGLVPDGPEGSVRAAGNAAGVGAVRMLVSGQQRREVEEMVRSVVKIETATEPRFQTLFVAAMALPHDTAATPHLAEVIELPEANPPRRERRRPRPAA